jgi:hypothetical protein
MNHKCCVCGNNLAKLRSYLVVIGVLMPYCQSVDCQEHMKQTMDQFREYGIFCRLVKK